MMKSQALTDIGGRGTCPPGCVVIVHGGSRGHYHSRTHIYESTIYLLCVEEGEEEGTSISDSATLEYSASHSAKNVLLPNPTYNILVGSRITSPCIYPWLVGGICILRRSTVQHDTT